MWTMWSGAPVTAAAAITSATDSTLEPGSAYPAARMWGQSGTPRSAATRKISIISRRDAPGV